MASTLQHTSSSGALALLEHETAPITVRHAEPDDVAALHRILVEPQVVYWTLEFPFTPTARIHRHTTDLEAGRYTLVACADDEVLGMLGLYVFAEPRTRHVARLGPLAVSGRWQGRGVGSTLLAAALDLADNWLDVRRVELLVCADNASAIALYKKFGFAAEGTHRALAFRAGAYVDVLAMARLRGERPQANATGRESLASWDLN